MVNGFKNQNGKGSHARATRPAFGSTHSIILDSKSKQQHHKTVDSTRRIRSDNVSIQTTIAHYSLFSRLNLQAIESLRIVL
jgi:hypothetical protein